jgi:hypothetical protein
LKRTFHITPAKPVDATNAVLLCEFSQHHTCFALADAASKTLLQLSYYELKNGLAPDTLHDIIEAEKLDNAGRHRIVMSNASKELVVVPAHHFTEESGRRFFTNQFGNTADVFFLDELSEQNLVLVHAVPREIMNLLKSSFGTEIRHCFSCQLKSNNSITTNSQLTVHFTGKEIYVIASKEEQLKLMQTYFYTSPLDVVYYLLTICQQYQMLQADTELVLSGLVSADSAIYKELHQYFATVRFWKPATKAVLESEYPQHFFSSMYNLAGCVL